MAASSIPPFSSGSTAHQASPPWISDHVKVEAKRVAYIALGVLMSLLSAGILGGAIAACVLFPPVLLVFIFNSWLTIAAAVGCAKAAVWAFSQARQIAESERSGGAAVGSATALV